jgi:hypothetical protein
MERNWLIRTFQKQILGPVSKQKLLEFIQKGSVGVTDEICSGNGYWFSLQEKELIERYLKGDVPQSFNPVSEAQTVYAYKANQDVTKSLNSAPANNRSTDQVKSDKINLPGSDDLEYPDVTQVTTLVAEYPDITIIAHAPTLTAAIIKKEPVSVPKPVSTTTAPVLPQAADLDYPDMEEPREFKVEIPVELKLETTSEVIPPAPPISKQKENKKSHQEKKLLYEKKPKANLELEKIPEPVEKPSTPIPRVVAKDLEKRNDNYLFVIFFVVIVILFGIFFYYREILNKPLPI